MYDQFKRSRETQVFSIDLLKISKFHYIKRKILCELCQCQSEMFFLADL